MIDLSVARNDNERLALSLLKSMEDGTFRTQARALCTDDFTFANTGLPTIHGLDELDRFSESGGFAALIPIIKPTRRFEVELLHIGSGENTVFTERIDHFWDEHGRDLMTPRICGIMELRNGRISAMREYYDPAVYHQEPIDPN